MISALVLCLGFTVLAQFSHSSVNSPTRCFSVLLQVACALLLAEETSVAKFEAVKEILVQMGTYFQVQVCLAGSVSLDYQLFVCIFAMHLKLHGILCGAG